MIVHRITVNALFQVIRVQKILNDWNRTVQTLHAEYKWLLFFRIPKLMQLCKYLPSESTIVDSNSIYGIYQEVQFLLQRTGESYLEKQIVKDIKVTAINIIGKCDIGNKKWFNILGSICSCSSGISF